MSHAGSFGAVPYLLCPGISQVVFSLAVPREVGRLDPLSCVFYQLTHGEPLASDQYFLSLMGLVRKSQLPGSRRVKERWLPS